MTNFNKGWKPSPGFIRSSKRKQTSEDVHFKIALKTAQNNQQITNEDFEVEDDVHVFKEEIRKNILEIMCNEVTISFPSGTQQFIKRLLDTPASHKDIQFLENFGIKKLILSNLIYSCNDDFETVEIVIFMLKNGFFTKKEVLDNL